MHRGKWYFENLLKLINGVGNETCDTCRPVLGVPVLDTTLLSPWLSHPNVTSRCFKLACRAVGVYPPLELSHYQIKFAATSLYDTSVATLYVINSHQSMNSLTHSVPRIGSEDAFPVGPTSFEFLLPPDSPITISPLVGTVWPGKVGVSPTDGLWGGAQGHPRMPGSAHPGPQWFNQTTDGRDQPGSSSELSGPSCPLPSPAWPQRWGTQGQLTPQAPGWGLHQFRPSEGVQPWMSQQMVTETAQHLVTRSTGFPTSASSDEVERARPQGRDSPGPHSISELSEDGQGHAGPAVTETHRSKVSKLGLRNGSLLQGGYCSC